MFVDRLINPAVFVMNKLSFKTKLISSISVLFILLLLPSRVMVVNYYDKHTMYNNQIIGLSYITNIHDLIKLIQIHRGLTNGYMNGNHSFKKSILENETAISKKVIQLQTFDKKHMQLFKHNTNYIQALSYLELIKFNTISHNIHIKEIFNQHSKIIKSFIQTIHTISSLTTFENNLNLQVNYIAKMLQDQLLSLQESTAQLRGLGTGYFAKKKITQKQKKQLLSIYTMTKAHIQSLVDNQVLINTNNYLAIQKETMVANLKLENILSIINKQILLGDVNFDSQRFFNLATDALNEQNKLYTLLAENYKSLVENSYKEVLQDIILKFLGFILILMSALYIFVAFYRSIATNLEKLKLASKMVAEGKTDIHLEVKTKDILGHALLAFNDMSQKLDKNISFLNGYKLAIDESSIVSKTDKSGIITYANQMFCDLTGYTKEELIGRSHNIVRHPDVPKETFKDLWKTIKAKKIWKGIVPNRAKDGSTYIVDATIIPILDANGDIIEYIGIRHDITELEKTKEEIQKQKIDLLTSVPNRNQLLDDLQTTKKPIFLYLNIDDFAKLNDFYGTKIADQVLIHLSNLLKEISQSTQSKLYKLHADGFLLVFEEGKLTKENHGRILLEIINYIESKTIDCDAQSCVSITLSGGAALYESSNNYEDLLSYASLARKVAKSKYKKFMTYNQEMNKDSDYENNIVWINKIKDAILNDRIVPFFQPIIDNSNSTITKYESLVRLIDTDGKIVSPFFFLDIAKEAKLYTKITKIVLDKTFATFKNQPQYEFSINLTVQDIYDEEIKNYIYQKLETFPHTNKVIFEITESEEIHDYEFINTFIKKVKSYGVKIAIDDFGTGFANFEHIIKLNADFIKIDGSLIKNVDHCHDAQIITESIITFSKKLGTKTVVEFVHNETVYEKVKALGADYSQGFYLGEPSQTLKKIENTILNQEV